MPTTAENIGSLRGDIVLPSPVRSRPAPVLEADVNARVLAVPGRRGHANVAEQPLLPASPPRSRPAPVLRAVVDAAFSLCAVASATAQNVDRLRF